MGTCLGRCFNIKNSRGISYFHSLMRKKPSQEIILELTDDLMPRADEASFMEEAQFSGHNSKSSEHVHFHGNHPRLSVHIPHTSRDRSDASNTPPSSLDLEWEHEGGLLQFTPLPEEDPENASSSESNAEATLAGWSRITTPDSLEWDPVEAPLTAMSSRPTDLDPETEMLLSKIEHLTSSALRETGDWRS